MKILYATTVKLDLHEAPSYHVLHFCRELRELGQQVTLLRPFCGSLVLADAEEGIEHVKVRMVQKRIIWRLYWRRFSSELGRLLSGGGFDAAYLRLLPTRDVIAAVKMSSAPVCLEINGPGLIEYPELITGADFFSLFFTDSPTIARNAAQRWGVSADRFVINPNCGLDPHLYDIRIDRGDVRRRYGFPRESFLIGNASSFQHHHDFETIIKAVRVLPFEAEMVFIGDGPRREEIRRLCFSENILAHFPGALPVSSLAQLLMATDLCVNAFYGWNQDAGNLRSFKVYEYAAAGVPVIDTINPHLPVPEWAAPNFALVPSGDHLAMAHAMTDIKAHYGLWEKRAEQARAWALQNMTWRKVTQNALAAIMKLV